jgi:parallel beta-helix repeat protein
MHYQFIRAIMISSLVALAAATLAPAANINISPGMDIPSVVNANPAGTTFIIQPGLYRLTTPIVAKNGDSFIGQTACAPPATPCTAILSGARLLTSFKQSGSYHYVTGQTQHGVVSIDSTRCQPDVGYPTAYPGCIYPEDLYVDGNPLVHVIALANLAPGAWFFDYPNATIYMYDNPTGHTVETSVSPSPFEWGAGNNVTIENLTIEKFAAPIQFAAVGVYGPSQTEGINWVIKNNEIRLNHGAAVGFNFGWQILNNYLHHNGQLGLNGGLSTTTVSSRVLIQGNEIAYNNYAHVAPRFGAGGSKTGASLNLMFRNNYSHNNEGSGFHNDRGSTNTTYDNNISADNTEQGIFYEISNGAVVRNNKLLRNGYIHPNNSFWLYGANLLSSTSQNVAAYCNTVEVSGQGGNGINMIGQARGMISSGNHFHHNTVVFDAQSGVTGGATDDPLQVPTFFSLNHYNDNTYHLPSVTQVSFPWDNKYTDFSKFQGFGEDTQGSIDTKYTGSVPSVAITFPTPGTTISGPMTITGTAQDTTSISKVELYVDWNLKATVGGSSPFNIPWSATGAPTGPHNLTVMAYNAEGIRACYAVMVQAQ